MESSSEPTENIKLSQTETAKRLGYDTVTPSGTKDSKKSLFQQYLKFSMSEEEYEEYYACLGAALALYKNHEEILENVVKTIKINESLLSDESQLQQQLIDEISAFLGVISSCLSNRSNSFLNQWIQKCQESPEFLNFSVCDLIEAIKSIQLNHGLRGLEAEQTNQVINDAIQRLLQWEKDKKNASELEVNQVETENDDPGKSRPLWEKLVEIGEQVPDEEWQKLPTDFSRNLEHYLYGLPKEP